MAMRRGRGSGGPAMRRMPKRPIDKELIAVSQTVTTSVGSTTLKTTTFPCTVVGLRWSCSFRSITAGDDEIYWAIVVVPDGEAVNTPAVSNAADFYTPEQNVLAFGHATVMGSTAARGPGAWNFEGSTKTMRKLKQGDILAFITLGSAANAAEGNGVIQFFCKS